VSNRSTEREKATIGALPPGTTAHPRATNFPFTLNLTLRVPSVPHTIRLSPVENETISMHEMLHFSSQDDLKQRAVPLFRESCAFCATKEHQQKKKMNVRRVTMTAIKKCYLFLWSRSI